MKQGLALGVELQQLINTYLTTPGGKAIANANVPTCAQMEAHRDTQQASSNETVIHSVQIEELVGGRGCEIALIEWVNCQRTTSGFS
jgi:hypothetical protein